MLLTFTIQSTVTKLPLLSKSNLVTVPQGKKKLSSRAATVLKNQLVTVTGEVQVTFINKILILIKHVLAAQDGHFFVYRYLCIAASGFLQRLIEQ